MESDCLKMVKIDAEAFKNKFEKCLSEMMCSRSLKHKDILPELSGLFWTFLKGFIFCIFFSRSCRAFILQTDFFLFLYSFLIS